MNIVLVAINAKYIHSNLAVYSLKAYAEKYAKNENIEILSMSIDEFKKTSYYKTVKYAPSVLIIEDGKIVTFLDAEKNSDIEKYQDIDKFTEWVSKYIYLTKN